MLKNKTVILGVCGSIAAYKSAYLASLLKKSGADVHVIMTENAVNFINPITFETLTANKCLVDTFDRNFQYNVEHVALAKRADVLMIAPASANVIAKLAFGIADDMLTTTALACRCKKIVSPAMNTNMYHNPIVKRNIEVLKEFGMQVVEPASGYLACGDTGEGKMPETEYLFDCILHEAAMEKDFAGRRVLITAGATAEAIDPVRFITNRSTGKMGYALARAASMRGAEVMLISGNAAVSAPNFVKLVKTESAADMFRAVKENFEDADIIIKAAAVADYTPEAVSAEKIKKTDSDMSIKLKRTEDILAYIGSHKRENQFVCGFSMETENLIESSRAKLIRKNADMICANSIKDEGAGFGTDTNVITIITKDRQIQLEKMSKDAAAHAILDEIKKQRNY